MMSPPVSIFEKAVEGRTCTVKRRENDWVFIFGQDASEGRHLVVETMWRIVSNGRIAHGVDDDGQMFGLSTPIDGEEKVQSLLGSKKAICACVDPVTADIVIQFEKQVRLDIFPLSAGYEAWQAAFHHAEDQIMLIGGGGGTISFVRTPIDAHARVVVGRRL